MATDLRIQDSGDALDKGQLDLLEARLGLRLPAAYRSFLLKHNGGVPSLRIFSIPGEGRGSVRQFFSVRGESHSDLERKCRLYDGRLPPNALPIGEDAFGNLLLLGVAGDVVGAIAFWDHEREDEADGTTVVATSLDAFLGSLADDEAD